MSFFAASRERAAMVEAERRQLVLEKSSQSHQAEVSPQSEQNLHGIIESRADLHKWQQMLKADFDTLLMQLGWKESGDGQIEQREGCEVVCNKKCILYLKGIMTPFYFRSVSITKLDRVQINTIMMTTMQSIVINLSAHMIEYEIKNTGGLTQIELIMENIFLPILTRSIDGFTTHENTTARRVLEDASPQVAQKEALFKRMIGLIPGVG